ncbi:MAG: ABC transporter substrate-binding protein [Ilumatobacter sp.]|uniref:ABC transporter substrate-binding protein n=1 Tax=Ilumatobacter sp. TaxID=1967498 RepID=UPI003918A0EC
MGKRSRAIAAVATVVALITASCSEPEPDTAATADSEPAVTEPAEPESGDTEPADTEPETGDTEPAEPEPTDTEPDTTDTGTDTGNDTDTDVPDDGSVVWQLGGAEWFLGTLPTSATPADDSLEPVRIGMINQENTPLGSFPEVRAAAEAAVAWVNAELGGVGGRPVELVTCVTSFDVEQSQSCALQMVQDDVIALVGGVDVTSNGSYPVIEQNGLAVVGGIPANLVEQRSANAFFFSGGGTGAAAAYMSHAADNGAQRVALAYGEFESFEVAARDYGAVVGESLGLEVELVPFSIVATDFLPVLTKAQEIDADALIVLAADSACLPVMETAVDLGYDGQLYLTGACAADAIIEAAGEAAVGPLFNSEGPVQTGDPEAEVFELVTDTYATEPAGGAGTVGFRGFMNLYALMVELGPDAVSSESLIELARSAVDRPSFWGHPYTCDGAQVPGLPALCAPQQVLFEVPAVGEEVAGATDWIDTPALFSVIE